MTDTASGCPPPADLVGHSGAPPRLGRLLLAAKPHLQLHHFAELRRQHLATHSWPWVAEHHSFAADPRPDVGVCAARYGRCRLLDDRPGFLPLASWGGLVDTVPLGAVVVVVTRAGQAVVERLQAPSDTRGHVLICWRRLGAAD